MLRILKWTSHSILWMAILSFLVLGWIGLRYTVPWWLVSLIPIIVGYGWLRFSHIGFKGRGRFLLGLAIISMCVVALFRGYTRIQPDITTSTPITLTQSIGKLPLQQGQHIFDDYNEDNYVLFASVNGKPVEIEVYFAPVYSRAGKWAIEEPTVTMSCRNASDCTLPESTHFGETRPIDWVQTDLRDTFSSENPYFKIDLPITSAYIHQRLDLTVSARVTFVDPQISENSSKIVTRNMTIFVGSPAEFQTRLKYNRWQALDAMMINEPGHIALWMGLLTGLVLVIIGYRTLIGFGMMGESTPLSHTYHDLTLKPVRDLSGIYLDPPTAGAYISHIRPGSFFEEAGFREGDIIIEIEQTRIKTPRAVWKTLQTLQDQRQVLFVVWSQGAIYDYHVVFRRIQLAQTPDHLSPQSRQKEV